MSVANVVVLVGNPVDGLRLYGTFETHEEALESAEGIAADYWVTELKAPGELADE